MGSSVPPSDAERLGAFLTGTEAKDLADRLAGGGTLTAALRAIGTARRVQARALIEAAGLSGNRELAVMVLRAVHGARSATTAVNPLWTMPGHLARSGPLTSSVSRLVDGARQSITCSTFNFQRSSNLWDALHRASRRPEIAVRVYVDSRAADAGKSSVSPTTDEIARHLDPAQVMRSKGFDGVPVRNHAKFLAIDHRFLLVTSANFSWSAENGNVEFGVLVDNAALTESVEREMRFAEGALFETVSTPAVS